MSGLVGEWKKAKKEKKGNEKKRFIKEKERDNN